VTELETYIHSYYSATGEDVRKIAAHFRPQFLGKGDYFVKAGRQCRELGFVQSGIVRVYVQTDDKEVTQWIGTRGYFITELSGFIFGTPARWNIQALTDCELYCIGRDTYNDLGKVVPSWPELDKLLIARCFTLLEDRVFSHLHMTAEERFRRLFAQQPDLFNQVPLQYIASMLGMTPETLSRLRKKLS